MIPKILGALMIIVGCGGFGMMICMAYKREEEMLRQMIHALDYIQCELQFRMPPLPDLCMQAGQSSKGRIGRFWTVLSEELQRQVSSDVSGCILTAKSTAGSFPDRVEKIIDCLSLTLGQFDEQGQLRGLETARTQCRAELELMGHNRETRLRSYQTLCICAGVALVILLV